jgi:hypothetical protein
MTFRRSGTKALYKSCGDSIKRNILFLSSKWLNFRESQFSLCLPLESDAEELEGALLDRGWGGEERGGLIAAEAHGVAGQAGEVA